jgi:hypothetical protein
MAVSNGNIDVKGKGYMRTFLITPKMSHNLERALSHSDSQFFRKQVYLHSFDDK